MAHAEAQLASLDFVKTPENAKVAALPSSVRPSATMSSTSAYLNASAPQMNYKQTSVRRSVAATPVAMRPLRATSAATVQTIGTQGGVLAGTLSNGVSSRHTYAAGQSGIAGIHTVSLPALSITEKNIAYAGSTIADEERLYPTRPRRVDGEDDGDNSDDPFIDGNHTPIGDYPILLMIALLSLYILIFHKDKMSAKALFCRTK